MRYAAAARIGKIAVEQIADAERSDYGEKHTPPRGTANRIKAHPEPLSHDDKGDYREACQGSDDQRQNEEDLPFALPEFEDVA